MSIRQTKTPRINMQIGGNKPLHFIFNTAPTSQQHAKLLRKLIHATAAAIQHDASEIEQLIDWLTNDLEIFEVIDFFLEIVLELITRILDREDNAIDEDVAILLDLLKDVIENIREHLIQLNLTFDKIELVAHVVATIAQMIAKATEDNVKPQAQINARPKLGL